MKSLWINTANKPIFEELNTDLKTDVLIIGGGIAGILCAYMLQKSGVDYILIEADRIGKGVTQNTTAKITFQHGLIYNKLIKKYGIEAARLYFEANKKALDRYWEICKNINCDFEEKDAYVYSISNRKKLEDEAEAYLKIGYNAEFCDKTELPFEVTGAVRVSGQAQFNPLKFIYSIAEKLNIYENTKAINISPNTVLTNRGTIKVKKTVIATHFPIINKHGLYFMKMFQHRSYVTALKNVNPVNGMYVDENEKGMSFRSYGDLLLLGGGGHRTGKKGGNWQELREFAMQYYPYAKEDFFWATQDCITLDSMPYIGQYSKHTSDLYVATGFNKWGMTSSMVAAEIIKDYILEKENPFKEIFSPSRSIVHPQLAINSAETLYNLLTPTAPRCPHLGCALKYNAAEHSWDCPCHGSRFAESGKLIDNPATDDKKM